MGGASAAIALLSLYKNKKKNKTKLHVPVVFRVALKLISSIRITLRHRSENQRQYIHFRPSIFMRMHIFNTRFFFDNLSSTVLVYYAVSRSLGKRVYNVYTVV